MLPGRAWPHTLPLHMVEVQKQARRKPGAFKEVVVEVDGY
jgi:hypothetical protein